MSSGQGTAADDPIAAAIESLRSGLDEDESATLARLVRSGVDSLDTTAPAEFIAREEIAPAAELAPAQRLDWAREFALAPVVARLNNQAWQLATALVDRSRPPDELAAEAEALLARLEAVNTDELSGERRDRIVRRRNEAIADVRWVMSGGQGPASLRAGRYKAKH